MKYKKLLAGILSAAMVLGTMAVPVFADGKTPDEAFQEAFDAKASTITLTGDITVNTDNAYEPVPNFNFDCTIDLAGNKLTKGNITRFDITNGANVKFTSSVPGAKIDIAYTGDQVFCVKNGTLSFENIEVIDSYDCSWAAFVDTQYMDGNAKVNFDNCKLNLDQIANVVRCFYGSTDYTKDLTINNTTMESENKTIWGGDTCVVSGNSTIKGEIVAMTEIRTDGNNVTLPEGTVSTPVPFTVTDTNGQISTFETFEAAFNASTDGDTITLYADGTYADRNIEAINESRTIALNGNTLNLAGDFAAFRGNWTITGDADRKSKIKILGTNVGSGNSDSLLSIGYYNSDNSTLSVSGATIEAPNDGYEAACGLMGAYFGSKLSLENVTVIDAQNKETHPNACKTIFYGQSPNNNCTINLTDVDVETGEVEKIIGNCKNVNVDDFTFSGKITEYALQVLENATIKNSTFTFDEDNSDITALYRDAGNKTNVVFENTVFENVPKCTEGMFYVANEESTVAADENTVVVSKAGQTAFAAKVTNAAGTDTMYPTLAAAIANANDGDTVTLLASASGDGIVVSQGKFETAGLTVDLNGNTYTISGKAVGSTGSVTNGFQLLRDNTITFKNGKITSTEDVQCYNNRRGNHTKLSILIQNYSNLTLEGVTLDGANLLTDNYEPYALSNNNGTVKIVNSTITAENGYAFDVYNSASYDGVTVTVEDSTINGYVKIDKNTDSSTRAFLKIGSETYSANGIYYKQGNKFVNMTTAQSDRKIKAKATEHNVRAGQQFDVNVVLEADDIATAGFTLKYDTNLFRLVSDPTNDGEITFFDNAGGLANTYVNGAALATYTFEALSQTADVQGTFELSNTEAYTYEENRLGMTFNVAKADDDVTISLNSFTATVKLDGQAVTGDAATLNYDGKAHNVTVSVEPTDYKSIDVTCTVNGKKYYGDVKEPGEYVFTYNVVAHNGYNNCSGTFTLTILEPNAYYVEVNTNAGKKADYVAGKKLVLVYTDLNNVAFRYNGKDMIEVTKAIGNYQYSGSETEQTNFSHVYAYVADKTSENTFASYSDFVTPFIVKDGYKIEKIDKYGFDINNSVGIDKQDPGTAIGVYGALDVYYENYGAQKNILKADVNGDKCVTQEDVKEVTLAAFNN